MIDTVQINKLRENEQLLLTHLRENTPPGCQRDEFILDNCLHICVIKPGVRNRIDVWYDGDLLVLGIGDWTHDHPESLDELTNKIIKIVEEKIVLWRVTRPNGYEYSGHYDSDELMKEGPQFIDEPDTGVESGDHLQKETFTQLLEDRVI